MIQPWFSFFFCLKGDCARGRCVPSLSGRCCDCELGSQRCLASPALPQLDYRREREAVDEIMRKIDEEDALSAAAAAAKRAETQAFIAAFLANQQHLRWAPPPPHRAVAHIATQIRYRLL